MTMANEQRLRIIIEAVDRASQTIQSISHRMAAQFRQFGRQMLLMGGIVTGFVALAVKAAGNQQRAFEALRGSIEATGRSYEQVRGNVNPLIEELARLSKFSQTEVADALRVLINTTGNYDTALRLLPAAVTIAAATGQSIVDLATVIGGAIRGDAGAIKALTDLGLSFGLTNDAILKSGVAITVADVAGIMGTSLTNAATIINLALKGDQGAIAALNAFGISVRQGGLDVDAFTAGAMTRFKGAMEASNDPITRISQALASLATTIGTVMTPVLVPLATFIESIVAKIQAWIIQNPVLAQTIAEIAIVLGGVLVTLGTLSLTIGLLLPLFAALSSPIGLVGIAIAALGVAAWLLYSTWSSAWNSIRYVTSTIVNSIITIVNYFLSGLNLLKNNIISIVNSIIQSFNNFIYAFNQLSSTFGYSLPFLPYVPYAYDIPLIPLATFQKGGIVTAPTLAMVGEAGPEAIVPLTGAGGGMGAGYGGMIVVNINGPVFGIPELKRLIIDTVREQAIRGGFSRVWDRAHFVGG